MSESATMRPGSCWRAVLTRSLDPRRIILESVAVPETITILRPWALLDADRAKALEVELARELPAGHVLQGRNVTAVAARIDCDDVTFEIDDGTGILAVVHMTWQRETSPKCPRTKLFESWEQWVQAVSIPSHDEYTLGE